jgi:hypothetical protein
MGELHGDQLLLATASEHTRPAGVVAATQSNNNSIRMHISAFDTNSIFHSFFPSCGLIHPP